MNFPNNTISHFTTKHLSGLNNAREHTCTRKIRALFPYPNRSFLPANYSLESSIFSLNNCLLLITSIKQVIKGLKGLHKIF